LKNGKEFSSATRGKIQKGLKGEGLSRVKKKVE